MRGVRLGRSVGFRASDPSRRAVGQQSAVGRTHRDAHQGWGARENGARGVNLTFRGTSDARSSVDRDTRIRIALSPPQAGRLWYLLGDVDSPVKRLSRSSRRAEPFCSSALETASGGSSSADEAATEEASGGAALASALQQLDPGRRALHRSYRSTQVARCRAVATMSAASVT